MVSLREIRKRIHSVHNIKQIAKAMEMVAGVELRHVEDKMFLSRIYFSKIQEILSKLVFPPDESEHSIFEQREKGKTAVVVVGSDRGLCGSYNAMLHASTDAFLKTLSGEEIELIPIGRKAIGYYRSRDWKIGHQIAEWGGKITKEEIQALTDRLMGSFLSKEYKAIWIIYTQFITLLSRKVSVEKIFPIEKGDSKQLHDEPILEPNWGELFEAVLSRWSRARIQNVLDEAYASELAARVISMKTANKNAEEMIERLTLIRNKVRQENITEELIEIVIGAESLK